LWFLEYRSLRNGIWQNNPQRAKIVKYMKLENRRKRDADFKSKVIFEFRKFNNFFGI
jgi:hypothetical protein